MKHISFKVLLMVFASYAFAGERWPQFLGPNRDGSVSAPGLFDGEVNLERIWIQPLGFGYSGVTVGDGKLYTMFSDVEMDVLSCFDAATGKKLWSHPYGASLPPLGKEGGPLSTPLLDANRIYAVGARGELFCLQASDGKQVWARDLVKELGALPSDAGIATSPLISGDLLILNVGGGKDKGTVAFNKKTGALVWHLGAEKITYQSPALVTLLGRKQVLARSGNTIRGIDPATGQEIWQSADKGGVVLVAIGDNMILSDYLGGFTLYSLADTTDNRWSMKEMWSSIRLELGYDVPAHYKGYLYGFKGAFLSCLELETGKKIWSSREAGKGLAILADGHLAILSRDGSYRIVRASQRGYEQRALIQVFEKSGITEPSYADRVFYMRNNTHIAAVRVK